MLDLPAAAAHWQDRAIEIAQAQLPVGTAEALRRKMIDDLFGETPEAFLQIVRERAEALAADPALPRLIEEKHLRSKDEVLKPLTQYQAEELERMKLNFFGFDPSYQIARYNFIRTR